MKKTSSRKKIGGDEMRPEYRFDYRKARPNRFAGQIDKGVERMICARQRLKRRPKC